MRTEGVGLMAAEDVQTREIHGVAVELREQGSGRPLLFLHPGHPSGPLPTSAPVLAQLAQRFHVLAPTHPGFGKLPAPDHLTTVDDLAYLYLDLLDSMNLKDVVVVGVSLGGWIAAEMAVKSTARMSRLVLANPVGIKIGGREARDIVDIYAIFDKEIAALAYADAKVGTPDRATLSEDEFLSMARSRETTARYAWAPYMHHPKLRGRLHRIDVPTLVLAGEADRILAPGYARGFADSIPVAKFSTLAATGHFPHMETPDAFAAAVTSFARG